ncbi:MAG TPA: phage terminase large subunit [Alphaproteobacteria bacterium]
MTNMIATQSFELFLSLWNLQQHQSTPAVHQQIAHWLTQNKRRQHKRFVLLAFRGCGKSTLIGLYCAWRLFTDPNLRILVVAADQMLATKMVRMVRKIIEKHPLTKTLRPLKTEQWAADRLTVQRPLVNRDPSIMAAGIKSNITGMRADMIICDDVEVPKTSDSADKRAQLRQHLKELDFILTPQGEILYIGTPHAQDSIYSDYTRDHHKLEIPLEDQNGHSAWPERFPPERIARIRKQVGPLHFASQMLLQPVQITKARLEPQLLRPYDAPLVLREAGGESILTINGERMVSCACWWDPALGNTHGDSSVIVCVYTDTKGHYWLHGLHYLHHDPNHPDDNATQQGKQIVQFLRLHHALHVHVEINGLGQFLPALLAQVFSKEKWPARIIPVTARQNKTQRILQTLDPILAARALHVHETVMHSPLIGEMQDFNPSRGTNQDDALDALCGALAAQPVRLPRVIVPLSSTLKHWQPHARTFHATADFTL